MRLDLSRASLVALVVTAVPSEAQQCYSPQNQCFSFAPPGEEVEPWDLGLTLRSNDLKITGDIRFRMRIAETDGDTPYNDARQETTRTRVQLDYTVSEYASAFVEFIFSEVWAGAEGYSDAQPDTSLDGFASRENFNGIGQAYMQLEDAFGLGTSIRVGRSYYFLANGLVLGSCDFLQYPGAFTGAWVSRGWETESLGRFDIEVFGFDNYGPLQSQLTGGGERYVGATGRWTPKDGTHLRTVNAYHLIGTGGGDEDRNSDDDWTGLELDGDVVGDVDWFVQVAHRKVDAGDDVSAGRARLEWNPVCDEDSVLRQVAYTFTDSEGALHVNPADFNTAGLLHQYAGIWRSDLQTNQLSASFTPGWDLDVTATVLTLDRRGSFAQQGELEGNVLVGKEFRSGLHAGLGYGIDDEGRQVGYGQLTLYF